MIQMKNFIAGKLVEPISGQYIDNPEPATGELFSKIPNSDERDVAAAYDAAHGAFPAWSKSSNEFRHDILFRLSELIGKNLDRLAEAESRDNGKPVSLARRVDIPRAQSNFKFFATSILHFSSESHEMVGDSINYTLRQPIGVVGCISPWNLPLYLFTWKIAPALAAGNTVVAKPSEITPYTAYLLSELCIEAGLPAGVLNIVHGTGQSAGAAIVQHPGIKAISFTGGTKTGAWIAQTAGPMFKKMSLELGGKNPHIIFEDADFDAALKTAALAAFANQGQICLCGSRMYIHENIYERFRDALVEKVQGLRIGDPMEPDTQFGALVSETHLEKVMGYLDLARKEGGKVLCGGERLQIPGRCSKGYFLSPAVIEDLPIHCRTNQEEIFGPVVTLSSFRTDEEALQLANHSPYGLSASIWTENLSRAHRIASGIEAGIVWVNTWLHRDLRTPFGGVKQSGIGREGGWEALRFFTEAKNVCIKWNK